MRRLGLLGGMAWPSTAEAYRLINEGVQRRLGDVHSAPLERPSYRGRLERHGLQVVVPDADDRAFVHRVIYDELVLGEVRDERRGAFLAIVERLAAAGAGGVVAGCTEIELLVRPGDVSLPYFPTTRLHAQAAVDWILGS